LVVSLSILILERLEVRVTAPSLLRVESTFFIKARRFEVMDEDEGKLRLSLPESGPGNRGVDAGSRLSGYWPMPFQFLMLVAASGGSYERSGVGTASAG